MSKLAQINGFSHGVGGVYQAGSAQREFNYSDGEESEAKLYKILSRADDLSCESAELQEQICDWPSQYPVSYTHLTLPTILLV